MSGSPPFITVTIPTLSMSAKLELVQSTKITSPRR
jgi:hypothetical protein